MRRAYFCLFLCSTATFLLSQSKPVPTQTQNVTFTGVQTTVPASGLNCARGVGLDGAGDVFIADSNNNRVIEVPVGGGAQLTVGSGLAGPQGVEVDKTGDIFIADTNNNRVIELPAGGGAPFTVGSGLSYPGAVAVDGAGDVFIADSRHGRVVEVPAGGGAQFTVASGLGYNRDVALDGAGDVFIAETDKNQVIEVPVSGAQTIVPASGLSSPSGVAVDAAGNVFITDSGNSRVVEVPAGGRAQSTVCGPGVAACSELIYPYGVAVDGKGDVFIVDHAGPIGACPEPGATSRVVVLQLVAVNFGNVYIDSSSTLTLNYDVAATTTFGVINVLTQGVPNLDFTLGSGSTCTGTISAGNSCTVNVAFSPLALGVRTGTVQLTDSSGNLLVTTSVQGVGLAVIGSAPTTTALVSSLNPSSFGQAVTLTATVTTSGSTAPTGTVLFMDGATTVGMGTLNSSGVATYTTSSLAVGQNSMSAVYSGDANNAGSTSAVLTQTVNAADFTLSPSPSSVTVAAGQSATFTITVTPQGSFSSPISFSCSGLPALAACAFSPTSVIPKFSTVTSTLTITTAAPTASLVSPSGRRPSPLYATWLVLPAVLLGTAGITASKRKKLLGYCLAFLLGCACLFQVACGSNGSGSGGGGTPAGTYTIIVTGASGSTQNTTPVTLTVQ
jgi:hypothetical protein